MTRNTKEPSAFDSAVDIYVSEQMALRGGALTSDDLSEFIKKFAKKFLESSLRVSLTIT